MAYIDPHIHMVSRTTDDYEKMAVAGCLAVTEPAFWAGFDRSTANGFYDYFKQLTEIEPSRAAQYGIDHYTWLCINPKEAEDLVLAREVIALIPEFINKPSVIGIGEIGLNKNSKNEIEIFEEQVNIAIKYNQPIMIHTPHLEDKLKGTKLIVDVLKNHPQVKPDNVIIDHIEEHTAALVKDNGFWAGITLYPNSKSSIARAADIIEVYGKERIMVNSAGDWGHSDPLAVPKFQLEMRLRGHNKSLIDLVTLHNPIEFFSKSANFKKEKLKAWMN